MKKISDCGRVYIMTNEAMPGLVKIGHTKRDEVESRIKELSSATGVPLRACEVPVHTCKRVEDALHKAFEPHKVGKEFYRLDPEQPKAILELLDGVDITEKMQRELHEEEADSNQKSQEKRKSRPVLSFIQMGISIGAKLIYVKDQKIYVNVISARKVIYNGKETYLTTVVKDLLNIKRPVYPTPYWTYNGRNLQDIYNETYPLEQD